MLDYKFKKKATYLCACTYGPDSMALLDMLQKEGIKPVVVCINYHKFEDSSEDYIKLAGYCGSKGLDLRYLDAATLPDEEAYHDGDDFHAWARNTRYAFFKKVYDETKASGLVIAHHQDDVLETYLMQKERKGHVAKYGMSPVSTNNGMVIIRPLLHFTKEDLLEYDEENRVPFSVKKSNYEDSFTRSPIRAQLNALSEIDRANLIAEMESLNDEKLKLVKEFNSSIDDGEELEIRPLIALTHDEFASTLIRFVSRAPEEIVLTPEMIADIRKFILSPVPNATFPLGGETFLIKVYDLLTLGRNYEDLRYSYTLEKPGKLATKDFELDFSMGAEDRGIKASDYPLTIRTATPSDRYIVHGFLEPVLSLYSVWKMPVRLRYVWPIFINKDGKIVYVPRYRRYFAEYHSSTLKMFVNDDEK